MSATLEINPVSTLPARRTRVLLVESQAILRAGLRALLEGEPDLQVVGDVATLDLAAAALAASPADVVVCDLPWPGPAGTDAIRALRAGHERLRVLVLTHVGTEESIRAALAAGATGYMMKDSSRQDLVSGIRSVAADGQYLCPVVSARILSGFLHGSSGGGASGARGSAGAFAADSAAAASTGASPAAAASPLDRMTARERQVLERIASGQSSKLIARELGVSTKTVEKHRFNLMRKLSLHNSAEVTMYAVRTGLVNADRGDGESSD